MSSYETIDDLLGAIVANVLWEPSIVIADRYANRWIAWEDEGGDWWAIRPRNEDDPLGLGKDKWRPIGPRPIEEIPTPVHSVPAFDAGATS